MTDDIPTCYSSSIDGDDIKTAAFKSLVARTRIFFTFTGIRGLARSKICFVSTKAFGSVFDT